MRSKADAGSSFPPGKHGCVHSTWMNAWMNVAAQPLTTTGVNPCRILSSIRIGFTYTEMDIIRNSHWWIWPLNIRSKYTYTFTPFYLEPHKLKYPDYSVDGPPKLVSLLVDLNAYERVSKLAEHLAQRFVAEDTQMGLQYSGQFKHK